MKKTPPHTAGPWAASPADMFGDHNIILADQTEDCRAIAAVVSNMRDHAEVSANARLIAAAPELLEALEEARNVILNHGEDAMTLMSALVMADAAIAKAKGEAA